MIGLKRHLLVWADNPLLQAYMRVASTMLNDHFLQNRFALRWPNHLQMLHENSYNPHHKCLQILLSYTHVGQNSLATAEDIPHSCFLRHYSIRTRCLKKHVAKSTLVPRGEIIRANPRRLRGGFDLTRDLDTSWKGQKWSPLWMISFKKPENHLLRSLALSLMFKQTGRDAWARAASPFGAIH